MSNKNIGTNDDDLSYLNILDDYATKKMLEEDRIHTKENPKEYTILELALKKNEDLETKHARAVLIHKSKFTTLKLKSSLSTALGIYYANDYGSTLEEFQERIYHYLIRYCEVYAVFYRHIIELVYSNGCLTVQMHKNEQNNDYLNRYFQYDCFSDANDVEILILNENKTKAYRLYLALGSFSLEELNDFIHHFNQQVLDHQKDIGEYYYKLINQLREEKFLIYSSYKVDLNHSAIGEFIK